ncbi:DUF4139 domain-containing protein [candidate division WOR-3 bacterium]|nr:DUF4139 domain-containing protein [candidate division WOR-3 bacterium]
MLVWVMLILTGIKVTVYNNNLGVIKETREFEFKKGIQEVRFTDVAAKIDPTSVSFEAKDVEILEQNYEYDLVSHDKLFQKYIDKEITVYTKEGIEHGKLLAYEGGVITLQTEKGVVTLQVNATQKVEFPSLPEGLITRPTLVWLVDAKSSGKRKGTITYMTEGLWWRANYVGILSKDEKKLNFGGWVTITNRSGATYEDAKLKLVAGEVHRVAKGIPPRPVAEVVEFEKAAPRFEERAFFEYHVYDLKATTTIKDNQEKQIMFVSPRDVTVNKVYTYEGGHNAKVKLEFQNSKQNGLGIPLPAGVVRIYREDVDGSLEFIGEDAINHTAKDEMVRLYLGDAFDIIGERKLINRRKLDRNMREESWQIVLRNHKEEDVEVRVIERLYGDWEIIEVSDEYTKLDAYTVEFKVKVPADGEKKVNYTVLYRW